MKKVLLASILAVASSVAFAQVSNINKGNWMVGGNVGFNSSKQADNDNSQVTTFNISPNIGYFFIDNFAGGLRLSFDSYKQKNASDANTTF
ncbi:MAG TPA: hypothetical protein VHK91_13200, partial [Flavisolibacter sp.]|nr:hypothetical protein [Flavisolibacter sp.]